jgi:hypothetical protein
MTPPLADGDFGADRGFGLDASTHGPEWAARPSIRAGRAISAGWSEAAAVRSPLLLCISPLHTQKTGPVVGRPVVLGGQAALLGL